MSSGGCTGSGFLEYQRQGEKDGKFREIVVQVNRPNVTVQHRRGYVAS
jgi:hypothetical protein